MVRTDILISVKSPWSLPRNIKTLWMYHHKISSLSINLNFFSPGLLYSLTTRVIGPRCGPNARRHCALFLTLPCEILRNANDNPDTLPTTSTPIPTHWDSMKRKCQWPPWFPTHHLPSHPHPLRLYETQTQMTTLIPYPPPQLPSLPGQTLCQYITVVVQSGRRAQSSRLKREKFFSLGSHHGQANRPCEGDNVCEKTIGSNPCRVKLSANKSQ